MTSFFEEVYRIRRCFKFETEIAKTLEIKILFWSATFEKHSFLILLGGDSFSDELSENLVKYGNPLVIKLYVKSRG